MTGGPGRLKTFDFHHRCGGTCLGWVLLQPIRSLGLRRSFVYTCRPAPVRPRSIRRAVWCHAVEPSCVIISVSLRLPSGTYLSLARGAEYLAFYIVAERRALEPAADWIDDELAC